MKRSKSERPGFFSQVIAIFAVIWKRTSQNDEEDSAQNPDDSENPPIALPGSKWLFGCSEGATEEIANGYEDTDTTHINESGVAALESLDDKQHL